MAVHRCEEAIDMSDPVDRTPGEAEEDEEVTLETTPTTGGGRETGETYEERDDAEGGKA